MANYDTPQAIASSAAITYNPVGGSGDRVLYSDGAFLIARNGSGASTTGTITPVGNNSYGVTKPVKPYTVAAGADLPIPLLPEYVDPTDGRIAIAFSPTTTVSFAFLRK
ncbi:hypothetical protein AB0J63_26570 [Streptosporangium canum]|uniref:hypothetical protein n=1 Tax=Streptosporangium canum TaxID=324952 RepID=UPI003413EEA5